MNMRLNSRSFIRGERVEGTGTECVEDSVGRDGTTDGDKDLSEGNWSALEEDGMDVYANNQSKNYFIKNC